MLTLSDLERSTQAEVVSLKSNDKNGEQIHEARGKCSNGEGP